MTNEPEWKKFADDLEALLREKISEQEIRDRYWNKSTRKDILEVMQYVEHFLADGNTRSKDSEYKEMQEREMKKLINSIRKGDMENRNQPKGGFQMLKSPERQGSFYDTSYICEELIPPESFYRQFKKIVWPLMDELNFEAMYCQDNGRPPISPKLLAMVLLLQFHKNLSDREMERACMYDIEIKYALGLKLNERPFDHSSLGDFRKRLLEYGQSKMIFDKILNRLIDLELIKRDEIQRIDATHMIADIAIPTVVALVKKGIREILKPLKGQKQKVYEKIFPKINIEEYTREKVNEQMKGD